VRQDTSDSNPLTFSKHDKSVRPTLNIWFYIHTVYRPSSLNQHKYLSYNTCSFCQQFSVCRKYLQTVMRTTSSLCHVFVTLSITTISEFIIRASNFDRDTFLQRAPTLTRILATSCLLTVSTAMSVQLTTYFVVVLRLIMRGFITPPSPLLPV